MVSPIGIEINMSYRIENTPVIGICSTTCVENIYKVCIIFIE